MLKKNYRIVVSAVFVAAVLLTIAVYASSGTVYAGTYSSSLDEGKSTPLIYPFEYDEEAVTYLKIKPSKTGTITFTADYSCYVALCDANRNVISVGYNSPGDSVMPENLNPFMRKVHYGVKKGVTYNLKIYVMPKRQDENGYYISTVKYTNSKVTPAKYGSSKKKAKAIKKNKKVKGLFTAGNKKAQWFKVTSKQKKTRITISVGKVNYGLNITGYYKSGSKWKSSESVITWQTDYNSDTFTGTVNKKKKHTYYIKVTPRDNTSGSYSITWK